MIEYLIEARKFVERAREAHTVEVRKQDLDMAEWCIARAIDEADPDGPAGTAQKPKDGAGAKPS